MSDLRKMLERWAELEPAQCKSIKEEFYAKIAGGWESCDSYHFLYTWHSLSRIQMATQEAITCRGWGFTLTNVFEPSSGDSPAITGGFDAQVYESSDGNYADAVWCADADTPAEALLLAYLTALESL